MDRSAFCDLHTHSLFSDGSLSPERLIELGEQMGLGAIALTDHNTIDGLESFFAAAEGRRIIPVAGVEISAEYEGTELHLVGLFPHRQGLAPVSELLSLIDRRKEESNRALVRRLGQAGYALDYERLRLEKKGTVNRAVIAGELVSMGYLPSVSSAFSDLLSEEKGFYRPPERMEALWVIQRLSEWGIPSILAHPLLSLPLSRLEALLPLACERGLDAMETEYSTYCASDRREAKRLASRFGILESGGSDFHGKSKPDIGLGCGRGDLAVPLSFWEAIEKRAGRIC